MGDTVNQETNTQEAQETQSKTFTQEEVNAMFDKRFAKQYEKYGDLEELKAKAEELDQLREANKTELQKAQDRAAKLEKELADIKAAETLREVKAKVSAKTGVPSELLTGENEEACEAQAKKILEFAKTQGYPTIRDGGEVKNVGKPTTAQQFAEWAKENL